MTREFTYQAPPNNMVRVVQNIIEGYSMGPLRALAQDPSQNSFDARRPGARGPVRVVYELHERRGPGRRRIHILTITDSNTTGLRGPALSPDDLHERAYLQLRPEENWAAWEAMGYTKVGEDSLGSRGQGKAAFLYHSAHPTELRGPDGRPLQRMIILYDTLLPDRTYRLGWRIARPDDAVLHPPLEGEEARRMILGTLAGWGGPDIPLELEPLANVGSRVIVPFLSREALSAFRSGDLLKWLERCWWRAIQLGALEITVRSEGGEESQVGVPGWWVEEPWRREPVPDHVYLKENIGIDEQRQIKRIVLHHDPELAADEIEGYSEQFAGVQLLRGGQWIETLGAESQLADLIPAEKRAGFRGFVEFDRRLERELREVEAPQHDTFRRHRLWVRQVVSQIKTAVREFAEREGWRPPEGEEPSEDRTAEEVMQRIAELFVSTGGGRPSTLVWTCDLDVGYPRPDSTRVEWGESLRNITVTCRHDPADHRRDVALDLKLVRPTGEVVDIASRTRRTVEGSAVADFPDVFVARVAREEGEIACPEPGKYRLRAESRVDGEVMASAVRNVWVGMDPPPRPERPFGADIRVENLTSQGVRIRDGDAVRVEIAVSNRTGTVAALAVDASLGPRLLADSTQITVPGRPLGDAPGVVTLDYTVLVYTSDPDPAPETTYVVLEPGRHLVRCDVWDENRVVVASASRPIYVEVDPGQGETGLPFVIRPQDAEVAPIWELEEPRAVGEPWVLRYGRRHPTYEAALMADRQRGNGAGLYNSPRFFEQIGCEALVEWALRLYREVGDEGGFRLLPDTTTDGRDGPVWERYISKVEDLIQRYGDPIECLELQREVVSLMLYLVRQELQ